MHVLKMSNPKNRSHRFLSILTLFSVFVLFLAIFPIMGALNESHSSPVATSLGRLPLAFIPNQGQSTDGVMFETYGLSGHLSFYSDGIQFTLPGNSTESNASTSPSVDLKFIGANPNAQVTSGEQLPTTVNYFAGNQTENWYAGVHTFDSVKYQSLYPGIDLVYEGLDGQLKSTYHVAPGADPAQLRWEYAGAQQIATDEAGNLVITIADGSQMVEQTPVAWQEVNGERTPVSVAYMVSASGQVSFSLGAFNPAHALVIDPTFVYETVFNAADFDSGRDIAVDADGNAYVIARLYNSNNDVLILKVSPNGTPLFNTYLTASGLDYGLSIALDNQGDVYVVGFTGSSDFPTLNAYQASLNGPQDGFLTKLSSTDGSILFSTYFGGSRAEWLQDLVVSNSGNIYVGGHTDSTDFVTVNPYQDSLNLTSCFCDDNFVTIFSPDASSVLYSTYLGGANDEQVRSLDIDASGNIYITGYTHSSDYPTANPRQATYGGGQFDGFVSKLSADGSQLLYSTYLGGDDLDYVTRIDVTDAGVAYVAGITRSPDFPTTVGAFQEQYQGEVLGCGSPGFDLHNCSDGFITSYTPDGSAYNYSTFLGGNKEDEAKGIVVDDNGQAILVGYTQSADFPFNTQGFGAYIYMTQLTADGSGLNYGVITWSAVANDGHGIALGPNGDIYITGAMNAPADTYIARLTSVGGPTPTPEITPPPTTTPVPTATPPSGNNTDHVGDLDGSSVWSIPNRKWTASVTITVHDSNHNPVENATVFGTWTVGNSRSNQCTTDADGTCTITSNKINNNQNSTTFSVTNVTHPTNFYVSAENHDPDGDSDGTTITVQKP